MKLYLEPIHVQTDAGMPSRVLWRRQPYKVLEVEEKWLYHGRWWTTPQLRGRCRRYFRLEVALASGTKAVLEIFEEHGRWILSRVQD